MTIKEPKHPTPEEMVKEVHKHYAKRKGGGVFVGERTAGDVNKPATCKCDGVGVEVPMHSEGMAFGYDHPAGIKSSGEVMLSEGECPRCGATLYAIIEVVVV